MTFRYMGKNHVPTATQKCNKPPLQKQHKAAEQTPSFTSPYSPFQRISFPSVSDYDTCDGLRT